MIDRRPHCNQGRVQQVQVPDAGWSRFECCCVGSLIEAKPTSISELRLV